MRFVQGIFVVVWIVVGATGIAQAAPADPAAAEAMAHYQAGLKLYNVGAWEGALKEFREAYLKKAEPSLLFNLGQCQRQLGLYDQAEKSYRAFLREAKSVPPDQEEQVRKLIAQMVAAQEEARQRLPPTGVAPPEPTPTATASPAKSDPAPVVTAEAPPPKTPVYKKWWLWTVVGVAVVGLGVGLGVGLAPHQQTFPATEGKPDATVRF